MTTRRTVLTALDVPFESGNGPLRSVGRATTSTSETVRSHHFAEKAYILLEDTFPGRLSTNQLA